MNRKGQALVEFILILPIFLLILFTIIDFGLLFKNQNELENTSTDIIRLIQNGSKIDDVKNIYQNINISMTPYQEKYQKYTFTKSINLTTPFLQKIFGRSQQIKVERIIPNDE